MHARVISEMDAQLGLLGRRCAQSERPFGRMHATDFWVTDTCKVWGKSRMCATYIPDVGAGNPSNLVVLLEAVCTRICFLDWVS